MELIKLTLVCKVSIFATIFADVSVMAKLAVVSVLRLLRKVAILPEAVGAVSYTHLTLPTNREV